MPVFATLRRRGIPAAGLVIGLVAGIPASGLVRADPLSDGRFRDEVSGVLRAIAPTTTILPDADPGQIRAGNLTIALTNLYPRVAGLTGSERRQAIESYLAAFVKPAVHPANADTKTFAVARHRLRTQLVPRVVLRQTPELVHRAFSDTLIVTYVLDEPNRYQYVTRDMLTGWGVEATSLEATALANLDAASKNAKFQLAVADGTPVLAMVATGDNYDAARLMLPGYVGQIAEALKTDSLTLAIPTRDLLMAWPADSAARQGLAAEVREQMRTGAYARTDELFRFEKGLVRPLTTAERADYGR